MTDQQQRLVPCVDCRGTGKYVGRVVGQTCPMCDGLGKRPEREARLQPTGHSAQQGEQQDKDRQS